MEYNFHYFNGEGLEVSQRVEDDFLTYSKVIEKFVWFLQASGYTYLGAYRNDDGEIVITSLNDGEVNL